jgi:hypothetical protein
MRHAIVIITGLVGLFSLFKVFHAGTTLGSLGAFLVFAGCCGIVVHFLRELLNESRSQSVPSVAPAPQPAPVAGAEPQVSRFSESPFRRDYNDYQDYGRPAHPARSASPIPPTPPAQPYAPAPVAPFPQQSYPAQAPAPQMPPQQGHDGSGVGAALGGAALGGLMGYTLGGVAAARAAHQSTGRSYRGDTQSRDTGPDNSGLLAPIDGGDLDRGGSSDLGSALAGGTAAEAASGLLPTVDADDVGGPSSGLLPTEDADQAGNGSGAASGLLPPLDADQDTQGSASGLLAPEDADPARYGGSSGLLPTEDASAAEEYVEPAPARESPYDWGSSSRSSGILTPISSDEAERSYAAPDPAPSSWDDNSGGNDNSDWD